MSEMSTFAKTIMEQKYSQVKKDGNKETWEEISYRVTKHVMKAVGYKMSDKICKDIFEIIKERKFIPGGRYLYSSGKDYHQTQNCLLLRAQDSREGWAELASNATLGLMSGAGIGVDYSELRGEGKLIRRSGGASTGPISLMQMINELGRGIMQGGSRRAAIWAGLNWKHPDIHKFIRSKNWSKEVRDLKDKDFNFPATLDMTNVSVQLDDSFFEAYHDENNNYNSLAQSVYWETLEQMLKTGEPGLSIDCGKSTRESLRNAPVSGQTNVLTRDGYQTVNSILDKEVIVWTGERWVPTIFKQTKENSDLVKVNLTNGRSIICDPEHPFITKHYIKGEKRNTVKFARIKASDLINGTKIHNIPPKELLTSDGWLTEIKVLSVEQLDYKEPVYCCDVRVPEHSFMAEGVLVSNCTELTSEDDSDICNIGSIVLSRVSSLEEMSKIVELSTIFLLAGTIYSHVPYNKVDQIRTKNRRLGLGLMGIHEWLLIHNKKYEPDDELEQYLNIYSTSTEIAKKYANEWEISEPVKTRAIAPTGTIGIIAETTTGIEPIFCAAYKRRYLKHKTWHYQYVIDPTAKRLVDEYGINPDNIEDAYILAEDVERRVKFQAWIQKFVDHGISSTINLPHWGSELNNTKKVRDFGNMLINYLPQLRGITCYPDGARGGQPLTPIKYSTAVKQLGEVFVEQADVCDISKGGSCGS